MTGEGETSWHRLVVLGIHTSDLHTTAFLMTRHLRVDRPNARRGEEAL